MLHCEMARGCAASPQLPRHAASASIGFATCGEASAMTTTEASNLYRDAISIDACCPLLRTRPFVDWFLQGGITAAAPTVGGTDNAETTLRTLGGWHRFIREHGKLRHVLKAADIPAAKAAGELGLIFHFQGTDPIEDDLDLVEAYAVLGVRVVQLCYNVKNRVGDGAEEASDGGLSTFGRRVVRKLNEARIIVDCAHTGHRTSMDAVAHSSAPVIVSHGNPKGVFECDRNVADELIKAIAGSGGVMGACGYPYFIGRDQRPTLDAYIDHIAYIADLVGIEHVGIGVDYYEGMEGVADLTEAKRLYDIRLARGIWQPKTYPPPPYVYPAGIETPKTFGAVVPGLLRRGFSAEDVRKLLGGNWLRVYGQVWG
jgi:membrane dipeptidase